MKPLSTRLLLLLFFTLLFSFKNDVIAQSYTYFNQDYFNPYLYNPATIGSQGDTELNMTYRKELTGITNAPDVSILSFQRSTNLPIDYGVTVISERSILLNKSTVMIGGVYKLLLSETGLIRFGLSAGLGFNVLDLSQEDLNDPLIARALKKSSFITGQFGVSFQQKNLEVGISFPQLFRPKVSTENNFQYKTFDRFKEFVLRGSYRINFNEQSVVGLTPFALYRQTQIFPSIFKGGIIGDYKKQVRLGAGYSTNSNWIGYFGVKVLGNIALSYGFEFPSRGSTIDQNKYEINIRYRLPSGKKKFPAKEIWHRKRQKSEDEIEEFLPEEDTSLPIKIDEDKPDATLENSGFIALPEGDKTQTDTTEKNAPKTEKGLPEGDKTQTDTTEKDAPKTEKGLPEGDKTQTDTAEDLEIERVAEEETKKASNEIPFLERRKFYVVVGAFRQKNNAVNYVKSLNINGWFVTMRRGLEKDLYYVYTLDTFTKKEAYRLKKRLKKKGFSDVWIHIE